MYLSSLKVTCGKKRVVIELMKEMPETCGLAVFKKSTGSAELTLYKLNAGKREYFVAVYSENGTSMVAGISDSADEARLYAMGRVLSLKLNELKSVKRNLGEDASVVELGMVAEIEEIIDLFYEAGRAASAPAIDIRTQSSTEIPDIPDLLRR